MAEQREVAQELLRELLFAYRQPKVVSEKELSDRIDEYFDLCANNGIIPTVEEMCVYLGLTTGTVNEWINGRRACPLGPNCVSKLKFAMEFIKSFDAKLVVAGKLNPVTYFFRAKNYYGMVDKVEHEVIAKDPLEAPVLNEADIINIYDALPEAEFDQPKKRQRKKK